MKLKVSEDELYPIYDLGDGFGQQDEWERMYGKDDLTETAWDEFSDHILDTISNWFPNYVVDIDVSF